MTINRRWIAREWLYLLAGFLWTFVVAPIIVPPLARLVLWIFPPVYGPVLRLAEGIAFVIMYGPYVIFQLWRITRWAIRALREGGAVRDRGNMSFLAFLRSEPVKVGIKVGFLGPVI